MGKFIFIRLAQAIPVLFVVITATFFLIRSAPGGPFDSEKAVLPEVKRALEAQYNLDLPLHQQYLSYLGDLAKGDLGPSFKYPGRSVNEVLESGLPVTFESSVVHPAACPFCQSGFVSTITDVPFTFILISLIPFSKQFNISSLTLLFAWSKV